MRNLFLLVLFGFLSFFSYSQEYTLSGKIIDLAQGDPLESATIYAESVKDTTLLTYTISNKKGEFQLKFETASPAVNLNISYTGYSAYYKRIDLKQASIDLGTIEMGQQAESLKDVVVTASRAPVTIKKDTLEFNVASFKTKKGANVEDLLKELPGVEVDAEGQITVNGKPVNKILVNGKPFFGDDPTIATRNLTKEIVDKIQVTDTKTESEAFTGETGDDENKTINITIDEEKNKGIFGRVAAGAGTDERFEYAGLFNYFDNDVRLSVLAGGNNINSPGFSFGEIQKMFGNARYMSVSDNGTFNIDGRSFGGGDGITNSRTAGANYADDLGEKTDITTDYFYSASNSFNDEIRSRENILPDDRYFSNTVSTTRSNSDGHTANMAFKTEVDSTFLINIRPQIRYSIGNSRFENNEETRQLNGQLSNSSTTYRNSDSDRKVFSNDLTVTKKFGAGGGFFRFEFDNDNEKSTNDALLQSNTQIFGDDPQSVVRDQLTNGEQGSDQYKVSGEFRIPIITKKLFVDLEYAYNTDRRRDLQSVFDFDESSASYSSFNIDQSTNFTNTNNSSRPEVGIRYNDEKLRIGFRTGYVLRTLESNDALRNINFTSDFNAVELGANLSYRFSQKFSMYSGYYLNNNAPSVSQLSPYIDVSDPLNIIQGNPNLSPSNSHNVYFGLNNYDFQTRSGFYSHGNLNITNDEVVSKTTIDENFVRNTTYANVKGNFRFNTNAGYNKSKKLDSIRSIRYNLSMSVNGNRTINFNNDRQYASETITYGPSIGVGFSWDGLLEIDPSYNILYSENTFDLSLFEDRNYIEHEFRLRTTTNFPEKLEWNNDVNYNYNPNVADGFQKSSVFWNSSLAYSIMQDKGLITLKVYDLLDQNTNARRTSNSDYIQDIQSTVLQRYFMVGFSYKFNTLGKKGETGGGGFMFQ
ncbi:outer membrane beta-barrel protein [Constantimarinum furrinae]|uniref:TonB-dependent receptor n=1 Tax=Constantimarinum furrinae TaxID=2562285 RepID=A0A7G8PRN3_9FLAO|nr:outer membrane beta-barrel protein [Constantimarinum furrinae]QNJ96999.1 TonB-dependent receptor [Constantimarinum furrinae]